MSSEDRLSKYCHHVESFLHSFYDSHKNEPQKRLFDAQLYSLLAGGKRLRPVFVYEFCRLSGGRWQDAAPFAAAVEMVHTYSLIHDDLPSMDNDDYRRGRLTNHKVYGEAMAILAGDGLLTDAFSCIAEAPLSERARLGGVGVLSRCAGSFGMVGGQVLDILSEERTLTEAEVLDIQSRKTGALIKAACCLGVLAADGSEEQLKAAGDFADALGLAFQIRDDMLDVIGSAEELGKAIGADANKNTFVRLYGLDKCEALVQKYTNLAISNISIFKDKEFVVELAKKLTSRTK